MGRDLDHRFRGWYRRQFRARGQWSIRIRLWTWLPVYMCRYEWVIEQHQWGMSLCIRPLYTRVYTNESWNKYEWIMSQNIDNTCHTCGLFAFDYELDPLYRLKCTNESCNTYQWVMPHVSISHVTHINESYHSYSTVCIYISLIYVLSTLIHIFVITHTCLFDVTLICFWSVRTPIPCIYFSFPCLFSTLIHVVFITHKYHFDIP